MTFKVKDGIAIAGSTFVDSSKNITSGTIDASTVTLTGQLRGPASFTIDPAAVGDNTGTVIIKGDLQVDGTTTTINSTTVSIDDKNIVLADGAANAAAADGAGITVTGANATFTYTSSDDRWNLNKDLNINRVYGNLTGAVTGNASTASSWQTARTLSFTGDATGSMVVDGSSDASAALTLAASGVTSGTYNNVTVDTKGRVTSGSNTAYLTSESDTLATVTARGNTTSTSLALTGTTPISFQGNSNSGTYTQSVLYANQNNTSEDNANGIFIERGRLTDTSSAEVRNFIIGSRGGQVQWKVDGTGATTQYGKIITNYSNSTISAATSAIQVENVTGSQSSLHFTFAGTQKASLRTDSGGSYVMNSANNTFYFNNDFGGSTQTFYSVGTAFATVTSNYLTGVGSLRAPIFYDSDDTSYYGDFASTSWMNAVKANVFCGRDSNGYGLYKGYDNNNHFISIRGAVSGTNSSLTISGAHHTTFVEHMSPADSTTGWFFKDSYSGGNYNYATIARISASDSWVKNYLTGENSLRAPIFYDSDDTGYYLDPNSTSNSALRIRGGALFGPNISWGKYLYIGTNGNPGVGNSSIAVTNGNLHLDAENGYVMYLNNYSSSSYTVASQSMRSPIFYDNDDTGYYVDANSGSRLAHIYVGNVGSSNDGSWNARLNVVGSSHARLDVVSNSDGIITTMYSHTGQGIGRIGTYSNHPLGLMAQGGSLGGYVYNGSIRAPIFYDSDDTNYYADPNSTSNLSRITLTNGNLALTQGDGTALRITTAYGWINFGAQNSSWTHVYSDKSFYTNQDWYVNGNLVHHDGNAGRSRNSYLMYYEGFSLDANTMNTNATGFTYSVNAPYTGPIVRFSTGGGYDLWLNSPYNGNGYGLAFRTRNGDAGSNNSWQYPAIYGINVNGGGSLYSTIYYDQNDTGYYADPNATSRFVSHIIGGHGGTAYDTASTGRLYFGVSNNNDYSIYTHMENWNGNYTKLTIDWHTGIKIGAYYGYGGIRFYNNAINAGGSEVFSIAKGDNHVRVNNNLYVVGNSYLGDANGDETWVNDVLRVGASDSGDSHFFFGEDSSSWYGSHWYWDSAFTHYWYSRHAGSDSGIMYHDTRSTDRLFMARNVKFDNYGKGIVGEYASTRYQGVFAMDMSYKLPDDGTTTGTLYGLAWSHPNAGGVAANLNTHGLLAMENGGWLASLTGSTRARDDMRAPIFYDNNDTGYYGDFASTSRFYTTITNVSYFGVDTNKGYAQGYGTYSTQLHKIARITFDWDAQYNSENHGVFSTDLNGSYTDSMSINSFNDINLRIDSNNNDTASYVRFHQHTTGNGQFAYIGYDGSEYIAQFAGRTRSPKFVYDSDESWRSPFVKLQDSAPSATNAGDLWWQSSTGKLKIWYYDGNTSQWVDAIPIPDTSTFFSKAGGGITGPVVIANSLAVTGALNAEGPLTMITANGSTGSVNRAFVIKEAGDATIDMGSYPGAWTSALQIQSNDASTYLWLSPLTSNTPRLQTNYGSFDISANSGTNIAARFIGDSTRASIFYDLDDTTYYINANSTSYLYGLTLSGSTYFRPQNWIQIDGGSGLYWPNNYGSHFHPNDASTYTQFRLQGNKNSYGGIYDSYSAVNGIMYDSGGNGGVYRESTGRWYLYHNVGNNCMGVGTSSTSSTYGIYVVKGGYFDGRVDATIYYDAADTGYYLDPNGSSNLSTTITGSAYFRSNRNTTSDSPPLQAYSNDGGGAIMSFHRGGYYAVNFGLDSDNVIRIGGWSASTNRLQMDMSGNLTMAGNVTAYSDERLKKDWALLPNDYVERLAQIKSGTYTRIDSEERQVGVSAQDFQLLLTEAVSEDNSGMLSVSYGNAALASSVELAKRIIKQQAEIDELKALVAQLLAK